MNNNNNSLGKEYILQTQLNKDRLGKRRKTQLGNLFNRNKPKYPNVKPINLNLNKKKVIGINKLYPNLKINKDLDNKSLNDDVYTLYGIKDNIRVIDDRVNNDVLSFYLNKKKTHLYPRLNKQKNVLLSFNEWLTDS